MYTHMLFVVLSGEPTCPEVLVPVCEALAADRPLAAAELAAPIARDASVAPRDRRAATAIAVGAWVEEGSPAARCKAKELIADYFAAPGLPRTSALERRRGELAADTCELTLAPVSPAKSASPPPGLAPARSIDASAPKSAPADVSPPPVIVRPPVTESPPRPVHAAKISDRSRLALGGTLVALGVGFSAVTIGSLIVAASKLDAARDISRQAAAEDRILTDQEAQQFRDVYGAANQARWISLGVGLAGAATLGAGIPLVVSARRSIRLRPYVRGGTAGVIFSGAF